METTEKNKQQHHPYSSPLPNPPPSSLLKDISNFKTPKQNPRNPNFLSPNPQQFFTASKQTPKSQSLSTLRRHRPSLAPSQSKAARRLKAFELEQSKSARKAQIAKETSLKSLASSLTVWLNFLFENPRSCGCDISKFTGQDRSDEPGVSKNGKRDIRRGGEVGHDRLWRGSKRQRDLSWCHVADTETTLLPNWMFMELRSSLNDVCSFDDLKERMRVYLSLGSCKEIFEIMTQVTKNIDEGRLKMKVNCSIVTDVGMKKKAMRILMCYDPIWLRIGLYIIFGGDTLLPNGDVNSEQEISFLKMVIEKQFFSHTGLAEAYVYNKLVAGLYRPGYFEKLGNVILKRFLLLVLILDRAKSQSSLPISHGIDGSDGGSPLLFTLQSNVKSSRQMIHDFLSSDVMHGEGNLLAHLVIIGYKVFYEQSPLIEYDFRVTNLFEDLQDGVRLCRAILLLQHDSSILTKLVVPSDTRKKNLVNCGIALQHLKHAGVPLYDEDGTVIVGEDIVNGDKELTLSLLWNIFVHLQLPLLVSKVLLSEEILKIRGVGVEHSNTCTPLDMLLHWIQAICESYDCKVDNFASMVDGRAMWCLLDYYFRKDNRSSYSYKDPNGKFGEMSIMSVTNYTDAVHNFLLSQKLTTLLGKFPEVIQVSDLLEHNGACNDQSVIILLVFLSFQLIVKKNMDQLNYHKFLGYNRQSPERKHCSKGGFVLSEAVENQVENGNSDTTRDFKAIMAWWREMAQRNKKCDLNPVPPTLECFSTGKLSTNTPSEKALIACDENEVNCLRKKAASRIQLGWRSFILCSSVRRQHSAATKIQTYYRSWLLRKAFVNQKRAVIKIQSMFKCIKCWRDFQQYKIATRSATIIQSYVRAWIARREACRHRCMILMIQSHWRGWLTRKRLSHSHRIVAAIEIQSIIRGLIARKRLLGASSLREAATVGCVSMTQRGCFHSLELKIVLCSVLKLQTWWRNILFLKARMKSVVVIQAHVRGWIVRKGATKKRQRIVLIQSHWRGWLTRKELCHSHRISAAIEIQSFVRGWITRKRLLGASSLREAPTIGYVIKDNRDCFQSLELKIVLCSVLKLQTWWRNILLLKARIKLVVVIQAHVRGWIVRRQATNKRQCIVVIQSCWRGYRARKNSRGQLLDLRLRVQKSAANVDDSMRILNRLIAALSELLTMKSVSGILHTCETLDMATRYSKKCCEELVAAGAIDTILELIRSVTRSIPDQEVLRHSLSTLRNLARYPHLTEVLINSRGSVQTILWEFLRNKEEGYFIASELLEKICLNQRGLETLHQLPVLLKRLKSLVDDLQRRAGNEKRNSRSLLGREHTERRLRVAMELLKLITRG